MSQIAAQLSESAFLANLGAGERSAGRFAGALIAGAVAFAVVTIVAFVVVVILYMLAGVWPAANGAGGLLTHLRDLTESNGRSFGEAMQILGVGLPTNVLPMFAFVGVAALIQRRSVKGLSTAAPHFRWRMLLLGLGLSVLVIGPFLALGQMMDPTAGPPPILSVSSDGGQRLIYGLVCIAGFIPAAMGEEILFRGWLLRQSSNLTRNAAALLILNGVVFAAAHFDFAPDAFLERAVLGAGLAYMTLRLGGVELSCGGHAAFNLMLVLFIQPLTLKPSPNIGLDAATVIPFLGLFVAYVLVAEVTVRWTPLRRWSGADQADQATAIAAAEQFS